MTATVNARPLNPNAGVSLRKQGKGAAAPLAPPALVTAPPVEAQPSAQPHATVDYTLAKRPPNFSQEGWASTTRELREQVLAALAASKPAHKVTMKIRPKGQLITDAKGKAVMDRETGKQAVGKGNLLIYGLARNPFTFYPNQILEILNMADEIRALLEKHKDALSWGKEEEEE